MALNHIVIMGRTTKTPELRRTPNGVAVTTFTLAVDRDFKNQNGERETDFIDCVAWKGNAEFVANYVTKGRMIAVEGRLQLREYTDKDGNRRKVAEVITSGVFFADSKREDNMGSLPKTFTEVEDNETLPF